MSHNTWIHRLVRSGVKPLVDTSVTPNQITTLRLVAGILAAALLAIGESPWHYYAAGMFLLSMLLDRADGQLARMSGCTSAWGHTYDLVSDTLCNVLIFIALGVSLHASDLGLWAIAMGLIAGLGVASVLWLVLQTESRHGENAAELESFAGFDADDAMLLIPIAILTGASNMLLIAACSGAPLFALFMFLNLRKRT